MRLLGHHTQNLSLAEGELLPSITLEDYGCPFDDAPPELYDASRGLSVTRRRARFVVQIVSCLPSARDQAHFRQDFYKYKVETQHDGGIECAMHECGRKPFTYV